MNKIDENRLRRMADRQGMILRKSRRRDPHAVDYGLYALCDVQTGGAIHQHGPISPYSLTLEEAEEWLIAGEIPDVRSGTWRGKPIEMVEVELRPLDARIAELKA